MNIFMSRWSDSEFDALGTMTEDLSDALKEQGISINDEKDDGPAVYFWMNYADLGDILTLGRDDKVPSCFMMFWVDSPLLLKQDYLNQFRDIPSFNLIVPHSQDTLWAKRACPWLNLSTMPWGCNPQRLGACDTIERKYDVVFAGGFSTESQVRERWQHLTREERRLMRDVRDYIESYPYRSVAEILDFFALHHEFDNSDWNVIRRLAEAIIPLKNFIKRRNLANAISDYNSVIYGSPAWQEVISGNTEYGGQVKFKDLPQRFAEAKVAINLIPAQAQEGPSERIFEMAGAGCAVICEDTYAVRRHYHIGEDIDVFSIGRWDELKERIDLLLADDDKRQALAHAGQAATFARHGWDKRIPTLLKVITRSLER